MTQVQGTNETGFVPRVTSGGGSSTYYCDYGHLSAGCFGSFGGGWAYGSSAGAFPLDVYYSTSEAYSTLGARLQYKQLTN